MGERPQDGIEGRIDEYLTPELYVDMAKAYGDASGEAPEHSGLMAAARLVAAETIMSLWEDKVEGLMEDLYAAVSIAYRKGDREWALLNHPYWKDRLEEEEAALRQGRSHIG